MLRPLTLSALAATSAALLASCAPMAQASANAEALTPDQLALLDRNLSGKEAGSPAKYAAPAPAVATSSIWWTAPPESAVPAAFWVTSHLTGQRATRTKSNLGKKIEPNIGHNGCK